MDRTVAERRAGSARGSGPTRRTSRPTNLQSQAQRISQQNCRHASTCVDPGSVAEQTNPTLAMQRAGFCITDR